MSHHHERTLKLIYESPEYMPFRKRLIKYTPWQIVWIILTLQALAFVGVGIYLESFLTVFTGLFLSLGLLNYFYYRKWVKYYIKNIRIFEDSNICYIQVYEQDELQKIEIPLQKLFVKFERASLNRNMKKYRLSFYENKTLMFYQLADVEHWTEDLCKEIELNLSHSSSPQH